MHPPRHPSLSLPDEPEVPVGRREPEFVPPEEFPEVLPPTRVVPVVLNSPVSSSYIYAMAQLLYGQALGIKVELYVRQFKDIVPFVQLDGV